MNIIKQVRELLQLPHDDSDFYIIYQQGSSFWGPYHLDSHNNIYDSYNNPHPEIWGDLISDRAAVCAEATKLTVYAKDRPIEVLNLKLADPYYVILFNKVTQRPIITRYCYFGDAEDKFMLGSGLAFPSIDAAREHLRQCGLEDVSISAN